MIIRSSFVLLALATLFGCKSNSNDKPTTIAPQVKYELSGGAGHYDYAPSAIVDKYGICYMFLCENKDPFKIVDHVYLYKGIPSSNGWVWQPGTEVVAPSPSGWDDCHICDPDVREFKTKYKGETYTWIMTYLGVDQWDCNHNQIGLALSKDIEGPWVKFDQNPLISYNDTTKWGVGQSTSIVIDSTTIRLFYHKSGTMVTRDIIMNNLDHIVLGEEKFIPNIKPNAYFAYSAKNIYVVSEIRINMSHEVPTWVGNYAWFAYQPRNANIFTKENNWKKIGLIGPDNSGFPRNHNPGLLTDPKGYMPSDKEAMVFFTPAMTGPNWLWSYDLYSAKFNLKNIAN